MMPDFPSATGTLSSWRKKERRREHWKRGRGGGSWSGSQQLVTSFLSQKAYIGAIRRRSRTERESGLKLQECEKGKMRCQPVCLLRLDRTLLPKRGRKFMAPGSKQHPRDFTCDSSKAQNNLCFFKFFFF